MSLASAMRMLCLQPQDKVVRFQRDYADASDHTFYVECVDYEKEVVHALTNSGHTYQLKFADISDIVKADSPITITVPEATWQLHGCDPEWVGKQVRVLAVEISSGNKISGLVVPKWPGTRPGLMLHLQARPGTASWPDVTDKDLICALPAMGFNPKRFGDSAASRNHSIRVAGNRVSKFIAGALNSRSGAIPPLDPSCDRQRAKKAVGVNA